MGGLGAGLIEGSVMHARLFPRRNAFRYGIYYLALPLTGALPVPMERRGFLSFDPHDHGPRDGTDLLVWARRLLGRYGITVVDGAITLVCMPRVMGYVFNPVSFWLCHDSQGQLRAVLCEVHNTFGETHTYVCARADRGVIGPEDVLQAEKEFHVSPFLERTGSYTFRFSVDAARFGVWIDYFDADGQRQLITALGGAVMPLTTARLRGLAWRYPLVTLRAITLIHWQAAKLVAKKIKYISKPLQKNEKDSATHNLTKM